MLKALMAISSYRSGRSTLPGVCLSALAFWLLSLGCGREPEAPTSRQHAWQELAGDTALDQINVILVSIDTLRADRLSSYGSTRVKTPNIDQFASEGVLFGNAASTVPFTLPAHSSIMTGTYPPYHGVRENVGYFLDESLTTVAQELSRSGWTTAGFVSAFVLDSRWGIANGFDFYYDDFEPSESGSTNMASVQRPGSETIEAAVSWLDSRQEGPFFMWLHLFDPHDPYRPPEPFKSQYRHPYDGEVAYTDSLFGNFRQELEERGLLENSLVILTGDHGEGLGQHQEGFHGFFIYDSTVHVPLIVRAPFGRLGGRVVNDAVSHVDLFPTILAATGQEIPEQAQGESLLPLMLNLVPDDAPERLVYSESLYPLLHYGWAPLKSIRSERFKFIDAPQPELYDLSADSAEQNNTLLDNRRDSRELKDALDAMTARIETGGMAAKPAELDDDTRRQLQALGYVAGRGKLGTEDLDDSERADPKDRVKLHQLVMAAQSDMGAEDLDKAEAKLLEALETDQTLLDAHHMLGTIAIQQADFERSIPHFQAALTQAPDHTPSILGLADAYKRLGREEEALVGFQRVLELDPAESLAAIGAADILTSQGQTESAIAVLESATSQDRPTPYLHNQLGELLTEQGRVDEAVASFRQAIDGNEELPPPHFNLAVILEEKGKVSEALALYERTIELAPNHYQALFNLGRLHGHQQRFDRQQKLYEAAIEANPDFLRGHYYLAKLIMDRGGNLQEAEAIARDALSRDTEHRAGPLGYYVLADILNRQGRRSEAQQAAEQGRQIQAQGG